MTVAIPRLGWAALALGLGLAGCDLDRREQVAPNRCIPGETIACLCSGNVLSSRDCEPTGTAFGPCKCVAPPMSPVAGAGQGGQGNPAGASGGGGSGTAGAAAPPAGSGGMDGRTPFEGAGSPAPAGTGGAMAAGGQGGGPGQAGETGGGGFGAAGMMAPGSGGRGPLRGDVPASPHCAPAAEWDPRWAEFEAEVLRLTNEARAKGRTCGEKGKFGPVPPLAMNPALRCAARLHSLDMGKRQYFAHESPEGSTPGERMIAAGYLGTVMGENIAMGQPSPEAVVEGWLNSAGHCANMLSPVFTDLGVGYWEGRPRNERAGADILWTQTLGQAFEPASGGCPWGPPFCPER